MHRKPIGYWLKHLDDLITTSFDTVFSAHGLTRRHWQVLTSLTHGPATHEDLAAQLAPFEETSTSKAITHLADRGWLAAAHPDTLTLTPAGQAAQARLATETDALRERLVAGMSTEDYNTTVDNLARMAANLESRR
ncbi:winged helix DNA-binding protein [Phytomonospora sp. NPDC050363]|uniref:MarR family winged helix-turn-helix transcriptional regulator n=1 Tax=Phytomonospora sp. NPDC050363 TaxID=3155642 RepID=UPI00340EABF1